MMMKVYLAGPDVFRKDAKEFLEKRKRMVATIGLAALSPLDTNVPPNLFMGQDIARFIYRGNIELLDECDAVIANISPFRSSGMDPGTAFEIGYAIAQGKPVFAYSDSSAEEYKNRYIGQGSPQDDKRFPVVEDFGLTENLMIAVGVHSIYGNISTAILAAKEYFNAKFAEAFAAELGVKLKAAG